MVGYAWWTVSKAVTQYEQSTSWNVYNHRKSLSLLKEKNTYCIIHNAACGLGPRPSELSNRGKAIRLD